MFRDRRNDPGVASGYGEPVVGRWLEGAAQGEGAAIPSQIADQLRGKEFKSFRVFRETFWKTLVADTELAIWFDPGSLKEMSNGRSPFVKRDNRVGKRVKFELHHNVALSNDGGLYDMENLLVLTPRQHVEVHKGGV
jgi:hypothetical protein